MHILACMAAFAATWAIASCDTNPWEEPPTPTHSRFHIAPTLYLEKPQAGTAIDVLNNHHDWTECINVNIRRRDVKSPIPLYTIPSPLPAAIISNLQCNPSPTTKVNDVHCGNVFNVMETYCRKRITDWNHFQTGNQTFRHRHYMRGFPNAMHLNYMRRDYQDDFNVTVTRLHTDCNATETAWQKHTPEMFDRCFQSLWGTWTGCNNNQGRGGTVVAGCYKYEFKVLDPGDHLDRTMDDPNSFYVWNEAGKPPGTPYEHHIVWENTAPQFD